ncbi:universal stress protein [Halorussus caseinilyticus]|uniref:Universal stress protein n=1 Tax=Halorussus caseinilyticus TaxID=3034025 RepID=A0ABD5WRN3_9EURY|nr:universal stress protein [Halorussus sp. DT72]
MVGDAIAYDDILVPTDGSKAAERAVEQAVELAAESGGTVHALYVMNVGDADFMVTPSDIAETKERLQKKGARFLDAATDRAEQAGVECVTATKSGIPEDEILDYAREHGVDLVVMGRRGRSDPDKPLIGSTTKRVLGKTDVPVRVV